MTQIPGQMNKHILLRGGVEVEPEEILGPDVVKVTRCKDCRSCKEGHLGAVKAEFYCSKWHWDSVDVNKWFCADGTPKDTDKKEFSIKRSDI